MLMTIACVTTGADKNHVLNRELKYKGLPWLAPPLTGLGRTAPSHQRANPIPNQSW